MARMITGQELCDAVRQGTFIKSGILKRLAGANRGEQLLKKVGAEWLFVAKHEPIDLIDDSVEYRLGRLSMAIRDDDNSICVNMADEYD